MLKSTFRGGVHPPGEKELTVDRKIRAIPAPREIILPLSQHIGSPNEPIVKEGDTVKAGQCVAESAAYISAPVHSPVSGRVKALKGAVNPVFGPGPALIIENDGRDEAVTFEKTENPLSVPSPRLIDKIKKAGLVGLGGAAFPTHVKLSVPEGRRIDTFIANGTECEPYLTCDHRLMTEKTLDVLKGAALLAKILGAKNVFLAVESNKLSAIFSAEKTIRKMNEKNKGFPVRLAVLKTKYPQGGEKQLIKAVLKREVPPGGLPLDVGVVVQNVGTCLAAYEAVYGGKPLIERCVTFTGDCLKEPGNFLVRFGTPLKDIIEFCGGFAKEPAKIIAGGPMMGIAQYSLEVPVIKGTTGVIFLSKEKTEIAGEAPCIRCGRCVDICPVNLVPTEIMRAVKYSRWHMLKGLNVSDCMECGACAYDCPSKIPLVQYIKLAKAKERNR